MEALGRLSILLVALFATSSSAFTSPIRISGQISEQARGGRLCSRFLGAAPLRCSTRRSAVRWTSDARTLRMVEEDGFSGSFPSMQRVEYYEPEISADLDEDSGAARGLGRVEEIGLFPLGLVLNPGASLPLHIFEMRYRHLFNTAWDGNVKVGLVMYDTEVSKFSRIGTIAKVMSFTPLPDGRILTINEGGERFRVLKVTREGTQMEYIKALVEYVDDDDIDEDISSLEVRVWMLLTQVLSLSNTLYGKSLDLKDRIKQLAPETGDSSEVSGSADAEETDEADKEELTQVQRQRLFSFAVSQVLDMPLRDQQLMLQSRNTVERLSKQIALLQKAQQYLAAQVSLKNVFGSSGEDS